MFLGVSASWRESSDFLALFVILSRLGEDLGSLHCVERGRVHAKTLRRQGSEGEDAVCFLASLRLGVNLLILLALFRYSQPMGRRPPVPAMRGAGEGSRKDAKTPRCGGLKILCVPWRLCVLACVF